MDQKDQFIFVTGIVGRAMGSGKFEADDILTLTERAHDAFVAVFGKTEAAPVPAQPQQKAAFVPPQLPSVVLPEGKDFGIWKDDKAFYGKKEWDAWGKPWPDVTWAELLQHAKSGDEKAVKAIKHMAASDPGDSNGKWFESNCRKIGRAKAVLLAI